jgi:hypothetical protein
LGDGWGAGGWGGAGWGGAPTGGSLTGKAPPYVYLQGVRQRQGYSVVSKNVVLPSGLSIDYLAVSFTIPPGHGVVISIDFNYFYRMRFKDAFKIKWKLKNLFEMDTITLSQV